MKNALVISFELLKSLSGSVSKQTTQSTNEQKTKIDISSKETYIYPRGT